MSHTDKTAPPAVKIFYESFYIEECHNHDLGPCDLPPRPRDRKDRGFRWGRGVRPLEGEQTCYWVPSYAYWTSTDARCPCHMCSYDAFENIPRKKRQRIEGKKYARDDWRNEY